MMNKITNENGFILKSNDYLPKLKFNYYFLSLNSFKVSVFYPFLKCSFYNEWLLFELSILSYW